MTGPSFNRFTSVRPQAVRLTQRDLVRTSYLDAERKFPLLIEPNHEGIDPVSYAESNRETFETNLAREGAILFRGFDFGSVERFQAFVGALSGGALEYTERSSPRSRVGGNIYTSTDYPPEYPIFLHNEQSYNLVFPRKILFYCLKSAEAGGATPIADCRRILAGIPAGIREKFERLGYAYVRNFGDGFGLSWRDAFQTDDRAAVEAYCAAAQIEHEWKSGGRLRTRQVRRTTAIHPLSGEARWFNHLTFFHVSTLVPAVRDSVLRELGEENLPNNTYYGDGSPIEPEVMDTLHALYEKETFVFPWRDGDVLVLDNMLVAHGREPFRGARKVVVGMGDPTPWSAV